MKDEIRKLFPLEFYINDKGEMVSEISLKTLNKLSDEIINLQEENEFLKLSNPEMNIEHFRIIKENKRKIDNLRKENERFKDYAKSYLKSKIDRKNDIQEQQNTIINNTKDRVDISLREYEDLKNELKAKTELLNKYDEFITELAKNIKQSPEILLKGKVQKSEFERVPCTMSQRLYVVWEFTDYDLENKGE